MALARTQAAGDVIVMRRWGWYVVAGTAAGCGLVALTFWSLPATVGWWMSSSLIAVAFGVCGWPEEDTVRWPAVFAQSLPWPTAGMAAAGLVYALGWDSALLVSSGGMVAAWEAGWLGRRPRGEPPVRVVRRSWRFSARTAVAVAVVIRTYAVDPLEAVLEVTEDLTDADLCLAWRSSYVALERASDPSAKLRAVQIRELLLDELGRRDAPGLEAWFRSGARAAGGPDRYLRGAQPRQRRDVV